jgi:choline dehydrogenase-like flavoprotein
MLTITNDDSIIIGAGRAGVPLATTLAMAGWKAALIERVSVNPLLSSLKQLFHLCLDRLHSRFVLYIYVFLSRLEGPSTLSSPTEEKDERRLRLHTYMEKHEILVHPIHR